MLENVPKCLQTPKCPDVVLSHRKTIVNIKSEHCAHVPLCFHNLLNRVPRFVQIQGLHMCTQITKQEHNA